MINLQLNIFNPWSSRWDILWNKTKMIGQYNAVEFNGYRTNHVINVDFNFNPAGDHGGARITLGLFGFDIELHFYDTRHWDYTTNTWEYYE
jgi:hypothetical protein